MRHSRVASVITFFILTTWLPSAEDTAFSKEGLRILIREVAAKAEEKYKGTRSEADGLVQQVEEILALPEPAAPDMSDRPQMLAKKMRLMDGMANFNSSIGGVRGVIFDSSDTGRMQRYSELESANVSDAEEVWRWLEMADTAQDLKWKDKETLCHERALGAARGLVNRQPKNPEAHALLGMTLGAGTEKPMELEAALKLDSRQTLALYSLLSRRKDQLMEKTVFRQEVGFEDEVKSPEELYRVLFDRPLSEEETLEFERRQDELRREAMQLLTHAKERHDLPTFLKTVNLIAEMRVQHQALKLASKRSAEDSLPVFLIRLSLLRTSLTTAILFEDDTVLRVALDLAADDPEATGVIFVSAMAGIGMRMSLNKQRPGEKQMEPIQQSFAKLLEMARADDSLRAARAAESVFMAESCMMMFLQRQPTHLELLTRAIHLDPFRPRTQRMLAMICMGLLSKVEDKPAGVALTLTELALLPCLQTRRNCAGTHALLHDWPAAHRYLDACLKEKPDDLGLLNQKAVTFLRENQSRTTLKKAESIFHKIVSAREKSAASKDDKEQSTWNHILFLMLMNKNDAAREEIAAARKDKHLAEKDCAELEALLP